jgi:hypothetical protein
MNYTNIKKKTLEVFVLVVCLVYLGMVVFCEVTSPSSLTSGEFFVS